MGTSPPPFPGSTSSYADLFKDKSPPRTDEAQRNAATILFTTAGTRSTVHRVNGCLPHSKSRPKIVIEPRLVEESVLYRANHDLICKFMGIRPTLNFLHSWVRQNWEPHGEYSLWYISNGYFIVSFSSLADRNRAFESKKGIMAWQAYLFNPGEWDSIRKLNPPLSQFGSDCMHFQWSFGVNRF